MELLVEVADARVAPEFVDEYPQPVTRPRIHIRTSKVNGVLGTSLSDTEVLDALRPLGIDVSGSGDDIEAVPPTFRPDLEREIDLVEEVGAPGWFRRHRSHRTQARAASRRAHARAVRAPARGRRVGWCRPLGGGHDSVDLARSRGSVQWRTPACRGEPLARRRVGAAPHVVAGAHRGGRAQRRPRPHRRGTVRNRACVLHRGCSARLH